MRLCQFVRAYAVAGLALSGTAALAEPVVPPMIAAVPPTMADETFVPPGQDLRLRADWIDQCRQRISTRGGRRAFEADQSHCATYYDDYYAYYARYAAGSGYGQAGGGTAMMTVPVTFAGKTQADCGETVEYEDVPVAARRVIHRPAPPRDKRIRIAPDKRLRSD